MSPAVKYTLGRLGLFVLCAVLLTPLPIDLLLRLMIALLVSMVLSFFLLRRWRDEMVLQIDAAVKRRRQEKERLRAALAGESTDDEALTEQDTEQESRSAAKSE